MAWGKAVSKTKRKKEGKSKRPNMPFFVAPLTDITIPEKMSRDVEMDVVYEIAESLKIGGELIHPILVQAAGARSGLKRPKLRLLAGVHRLEAYRLLGRDNIPCKLFDGDELAAEQAQLSENLCRKRVTHLDRNNMLARYCNTVALRRTISGQDGRKKRGRPPGGAAAVARLLSYLGGTEEARRKMVKRAYSIATIPPEVQKEIRKAGLADNQSALLMIAEIKNSARSQLSLVRRLAAQVKHPAPPSKPQAQRNEQVSHDEPAEVYSAEEIKETTLADLEAHFCTSETKKLWAYAPSDTREAFIEQARRRRCRVAVDVVQFITETFQGREKVPTAAIRRMAKQKRLSWDVVRLNLKADGYKRKKKGSRPGAPWYHLNANRDWKEEVPKVRQEAIEAALSAARDDRVVFDSNDEEDWRREDQYYES